MVFTTPKVTNYMSLSPLLSREKRVWKFYELVGQGRQRWIQMIRAALPWLALPGCAGPSFSHLSHGEAVPQQPPAHRTCVPSWWQLVCPWLPAGLSLLMLVLMPETPLLLKPSSCEQIQGRGGDGPGKQVLECPGAHSLVDQFLAQLGAPSPLAELP